MTVPQKAVLEGPQGKFVYVISNTSEGKAVAAIRPIQVGEWVTQNNERAWLVLGGLNAGDQVILNNLIKIGPDVPVQIAPPATPVTTAPATTESPQG
jgi:membrane fusion protein, multidrug efflux system